MLAYYVLFALIIVFATINVSVVYKSNKGDSLKARKRTYITEVFILLTLFMGLRATTVGVDIKQYQYRYDHAQSFFSLGFDDPEWGYNYISYFFHDVIKADFQIYLFLLSFIFVFALCRCIYKFSDEPLTSFILHLTISNFVMALSGLRQTLAISLILLSIIEAKDRKLVKFLLLVLTASVIHNSAIIFLPIYFLWGRRLTKLQSYVLLGVTVSVFLYKDALVPLIEFLSPEQYSDMNMYQGYEINLLVIAVPLIMTLFVTVFGFEQSDGKLSEKQSFFYVLSCLNILMLILSLNNNQLGRLSYYFSIGTAMIIPTVLTEQKKFDERLVKVIEMIIIALCLVYFFVSTPGGTLQVDNYKFFWQN